MRLIRAGVLVVALALGIGSIAPHAAQKGCASNSDMTPEQKARRAELVAVARDINTQQASAAQTTKQYRAWGPLTLRHPVPAGVEVKMSVDANGYSFSVVDTTDQCRAGVFSNEVGIIYTGQALQ